MGRWLSQGEILGRRQDGCEVSDRCLECPLSQCRFDDEGGFVRQVRLAWDLELVRVGREEHLTVVELAGRFGLTERTVYRVYSRVWGIEDSFSEGERLALLRMPKPG